MVDNRDFKLNQKRLKKWAAQQPFPGSFFVEMAREVENSISSQEDALEPGPSTKPDDGVEKSSSIESMGKFFWP